MAFISNPPPPSAGGSAGGVLAGSYPNPSLASDRLIVPAGTMTFPPRVLETAYQPSATRPTWVMACCQCLAGSASTSTLQVLMDAANPPTTVIAVHELVQSGGVSPPTINTFETVTFIVPAAHRYKLHAVTANITVIQTAEFLL